MAIYIIFFMTSEKWLLLIDVPLLIIKLKKEKFPNLFIHLFSMTTFNSNILWACLHQSRSTK